VSDNSKQPCFLGASLFKFIDRFQSGQPGFLKNFIGDFLAKQAAFANTPRQ
jgi:hypothetical protein